MVLLHGRGHAAAMWFSYLTVLSRGRKVLAMDLPGFGLSSPPEGRCGRRRTGCGSSPSRWRSCWGRWRRSRWRWWDTRSGGWWRWSWRCGEGAGGAAGADGLDGAGTGDDAPGADVLPGGPGAGGADVGAETASTGCLPPPETPLGRRLGALGYELLAVSGGRPRAAKAFDTLVPLMGGVFPPVSDWRRWSSRCCSCGRRGGRPARLTGGGGTERLPEVRLLRVVAGHTPSA